MDQVDEWVSAEFQNLAEVINDYDHNLFLEMVPVAEQHKLVDKSKVFRIFDDRTKTIVMYFDSLSTPQDILARLWTADQAHNNPMAILDARNAAAQALQMRKHLDELEAQKDFAAWVGKNTKSNWVHEGQVRDEHYNILRPVRKHIT